VENLLATKLPKSYDRAVELIMDLRDLAARKGKKEDFPSRLDALRASHLRKPSFIASVQKASLLLLTMSCQAIRGNKWRDAFSEAEWERRRNARSARTSPPPKTEPIPVRQQPLPISHAFRVSTYPISFV
jgi:hypothetical protein